MLCLLYLILIYFQIYYQNYESSEPKLMKLPGCDEFCPLDQFNSLYEEYFPVENACGY